MVTYFSGVYSTMHRFMKDYVDSRPVTTIRLPHFYVHHSGRQADGSLKTPLR